MENSVKLNEDDLKALIIKWLNGQTKDSIITPKIKFYMGDGATKVEFGQVHCEITLIEPNPFIQGPYR